MSLSRTIYLGLGLAFTGLGIAGYILPALPGTVFIIIALGFFKRSSPRMETWLLNHRWFGAVLRDWEENHWISMPIKVIAVTSMWLFGIGSILSAHRANLSYSLAVESLVVILCVVGTWYVLSRPTKPKRVAAEAAKPTPTAQLR